MRVELVAAVLPAPKVLFLDGPSIEEPGIEDIIRGVYRNGAVQPLPDVCAHK